MLFSLLSFDMATTALNNFYDYKKAARKHGYGYEIHNPIVSHHMKPARVVLLIGILLLIAVSAGLALVLQTDLLILLLGGLSFAVGILYSFGPIPISRMPLGEIFSGLFMGFVRITSYNVCYTKLLRLHLYHTDRTGTEFQGGWSCIELLRIEPVHGSEENSRFP